MTVATISRETLDGLVNELRMGGERTAAQVDLFGLTDGGLVDTGSVTGAIMRLPKRPGTDAATALVVWEWCTPYRDMALPDWSVAFYWFRESVRAGMLDSTAKTAIAAANVALHEDRSAGAALMAPGWLLLALERAETPDEQEGLIASWDDIIALHPALEDCQDEAREMVLADLPGMQ